jgi:hypothetical protein
LRRYIKRRLVDVTQSAAIGREQELYLLAQSAVSATGLIEKRRLTLRIDFKRCLKNLIDELISFRSHRENGSASLSIIYSVKS